MKRCSFASLTRTKFADIYGRYIQWCDSTGVKRSTRISGRDFTEEVRKREPRVSKKRLGAGMVLHGIRLT